MIVDENELFSVIKFNDKYTPFSSYTIYAEMMGESHNNTVEDLRMFLSGFIALDSKLPFVKL